MHKLPDTIVVPSGVLGTISATAGGWDGVAKLITICTVVVVLPKAITTLWGIYKSARKLWAEYVKSD